MDRNILLMALCLLVIIIIFGLTTFFFNNLFGLQIILDFEWIPTLIIVLIGISSGYLLVGRRLSATTIPIRLNDPVIKPVLDSKKVTLQDNPYRKFHYLEEFQLREISTEMVLEKVQLFVTVIGTIMTMAVIAGAVFLSSPTTGNTFYASFLSCFMNFLVGFVFFLFGYLIVYAWKKGLVHEVKMLFFSTRALASISIGILVYSILQS